MGRNNNNNNVTADSIAAMLAADSVNRADVSAAFIAADDDTAGAAYVAADRSGRATIRAALSDALSRAVVALDMTTAARIVALSGSDTDRGVLRTAADVTTGGAGVVVDWSDVIAQRVAVLRRAADMLAALDVRPQGVPDDADVSADSIAAALSDVSADDDAARVIASQRARRGGAQRDVSAFIAQRVADMTSSGEGTDDAGAVRIAAMRRGQDDAPSQGSMSQAWDAMHAGTRSIAGVSAVRDSDGRRAFIAV